MNNTLQNDEWLLDMLDKAEQALSEKTSHAELDIIMGDAQYKGATLKAGRHVCVTCTKGEPALVPSHSVSYTADETYPFVLYTAEKLANVHRMLTWDSLLKDINVQGLDLGHIYLALAPKGTGRKSFDDYREEVRKHLSKAKEPLFLN